MKTQKDSAQVPEAETPETSAAENTQESWNEVPETPKTAKPEPAAEAEAGPPDPLAEAQRQLAELQQKYVYLQAEYQNYRKRVVKDLADVRSIASSDTLLPFLTVFDYLSMAETAAMKSDNVESILQGLKMIIGEFRKAFDELGVKVLETAGADFDPKCHEAVAHENSDAVPEGKIIKQWSTGFIQGERLLRPARVVVSAGPKAEAPQDDAGRDGKGK